MDPVGTVVFPLVMMLTSFPYLFGWAKPVPVNPMNLRKNSDMVWVALAGPACNLALVFVSVVVFKIYLLIAAPQGELSRAEEIVFQFFLFMIQINLVLMWFNLIPVTPLDGSKVLLYNIPRHTRSYPFWESYEQYGPFILLILLFTGSLWWILQWPMEISMWAIGFLLS
jgi:Zn-dependent protease